MQFKNSRNSNRAVVIDMTPMIDIVFQLLIFFLVTAQMAEQSRATLELPKEKGEDSEDREREFAAFVRDLSTAREIACGI